MTRLNLSRVRGDTYPIKGRLRDSEGNPIDITGSTITFGYKDSVGNVISVVGDITDATNGEFQIVPTDTSVGNVGTYTFDIQMITVEGYKITLANGTLRLTPDILP